MYTLNVSTSSGNTIQLVPNSNYAITDISGLTPPTANINSSAVGGADGSVFNSARLDARNIVLTIVPYQPIEQNRLQLYRIFRVKDLVTMKIQNGSRAVKIQGYVESVDGSLFSMRQALQVSILCLYPYFQSAQEIINILTSSVEMFEFPFATEPEGVVMSEVQTSNEILIKNGGESNTGVIIELIASGAVKNPTIYDAATLESFGLTIDMVAGDVITINTNYAQKAVTLTREGVTTNIINALNANPKWFSIPPGLTTLTVTAESGQESLRVQISHNDLYEGV